MKFSFRSLLLLAGLSLAFTACKDDDDEDVKPKSTLELPAGALATRTLSASNTYVLKGAVYVPDGAVLTIEPGTIIKGDKATNGSLVVRPGGRIIANGTATKPIVFTSNQAKGSRAPGDWGGLVICGKAPVNFTGGSGILEGFDTPISYGGTDANDNSGSLKYVRIEFAGIALTPGNEINGLTLAGVGAGTTIDHIQVIFGGDDAFEFFGGTVNAKYLVAARTTDDMFDTDNGYSGKVQYAFGISDPNLSDQAGASNGFESDNDANGSANSPQTSAAFANVTVLGPQATTGATLPSGGNKYGVAAQIRRNSALNIYNSVFAGWPKGLNIDGTASQGNYTSGSLKVQGMVLAGIPAGAALVAAGTDAVFNVPTNLNVLIANNTDLQINANAFNLLSVNALPNTGSPLLTATAAAVLPTGFEAAPFRGAFGTTNWLAGWTNWDPQNTDY
jgi:hypothetical protein